MNTTFFFSFYKIYKKMTLKKLQVVSAWLFKSYTGRLESIPSIALG